MPGRMNDYFERFTKRARLVLSLAQEEAQQLNHNYMGTEHILLGLVREGEGLACKMLVAMDVQPKDVRREVMFIIGRGDRIVLGEIGMTPRAKKVMELAVDEARRLNHHYVGTEHLLLGLIREGEGIAAGVLERMGINLERARRVLVEALTRTTSSEATPPTPPTLAAPPAATVSVPKAAEYPAPKNNVVTFRLDDAAVGALDALVEAGIRSTRSDAAAWLISAGIEAHRELFDRVNTTVNEIRKLRLEAQDIARQVAQGNADTPAEKETPETSDGSQGSQPSQGDIKDPEEPEDLDELNDLDEPPNA